MTASIWTPGTNAVDVDNESSLLEQQFTATAAQVLFTLTAFTYVTGTSSITVYKNGLKLLKGSEFTETDSTHVTLTTPCNSGDKIVVCGIIHNINYGGESTYTPTFLYTTGVVTQPTLDYSLGKAVKIGKFCTFTATVQLAAKGTGNAPAISLPFTADPTYPVSLSVYIDGADASLASAHMQCILVLGSSNVALQRLVSGVAGYIQGSHLTDFTLVTISGSYILP